MAPTPPTNGTPAQRRQLPHPHASRPPTASPQWTSHHSRDHSLDYHRLPPSRPSSSSSSSAAPRPSYLPSSPPYHVSTSPAAAAGHSPYQSGVPPPQIQAQPPAASGPGHAQHHQLPPILPRTLRDHDHASSSMQNAHDSPSGASHSSRDDDNGGRGSASNQHSGPTNEPAVASGSGGGKRSRVHFSCTECHRRKQKCNRQTPCQHCIARKVPERCKTFQPGQDDSMDLTGRVSKLERTVETGFEKILLMLENQRSALITEAPARTFPGHPPYRGPETIAPPLSFSRPNAVIPPPPAPRKAAGNANSVDGAEGDDEANEGAGLNASGTFHGSGASMAMKIDTLLSDVSKMSGRERVAMPVRGSESGELDAVMWEYGAADNISAALLSSLPSQEVCRDLVDHFWKDINWLRHPIPERLVRPVMDEYISGQGDAFPPVVTTSTINVFACLMLVMAIASLSVASDHFPKEAGARRLAARRFEWAGRRALLLSQMLGRDDLLHVLGCNLGWRFLMIDRRIGEAWRFSANAVQSAYAIGLHRDGSKLGLPQRETDLRRGVWHSIKFSDLVLAMNLGRPPISDLDSAFCDTQLPTQEGLEYWWPYDQLKSHPDAKPGVPLPTIHQHNFHRNEMTRVCGSIVAIYQKLGPEVHHYSDVLALDAEILEVRARLPHYYQVRTTPAGEVLYDKSLDKDFPFLFVHRFLVYTELFLLRISLHRSYLLRSGNKGANGQKFAPSRRACIESAMEDLAIRSDFIRQLREKFTPTTVPLIYYIQIGTYSWFNSLLVASIAAILDPTMPELPALREQISRFVKANEQKKNNARADEMKDEMRDREATILSMFAAAIDKAQANSASGSKAKKDKASETGTKRSREEDASNGKASRKRTDKAAGAGNAGGADAQDNTEASKAAEQEGSREEATADVLLDLGKRDANGSAASAAQLQQQRTRTHSTPSQRHTMLASPKSSSPLTGRTPHNREISSPVSPMHPELHASGSGRTQFRSGSTTALSTVSGDSPSVSQSTGSTANNARLVDDAQADLNAWFQQEFAGGTFVDNTFSGVDMGMSDTAMFGTLNMLLGEDTSGPGAGPDANGRGGNESAPWAEQGSARITGNGTGSVAPGAPGGPPGYSSRAAGQPGAMTSTSGAPNQNYVHWSTLPPPAWGDNPGGMPSTSNFGGQDPLRGLNVNQAQNQGPSAAMSSGAPGSGSVNGWSGPAQMTGPNASYPQSSGVLQGLQTAPGYLPHQQAPGSAAGPGAPGSISGATVPGGAGGQVPQHLAAGGGAGTFPGSGAGAGGPSAMMAGPSGSGGAGGPGGAGQNFDPNFWAELISKIS